jgi:hypothetical protein
MINMISVIINYCSNERPFIDAVLNECMKFSDDIVVSYGSHLYDGTRENMDDVHAMISSYPTVQFEMYDVDVTRDLSGCRGVQNRPTAYWHNMARWTGAKALKHHGWVLVIDADEVPEGDLVRSWFEAKRHLLREDECYKMANYWYFKSPCNRAVALEDSILLIHKQYLTEGNIFGDFERDHLIRASGCTLKRETKGLDNAVMFHHFSWVRTRQGLEHKIRHWGHSNDIFKGVDASAVVGFIFKDDDVNDVVHRYNYVKVVDKFNVLPFLS